MRVRLVLAETEEVEGRTYWKAGTDEHLGTFGGVWDRKERRWAKPHEHKFPAGRRHVYRLHRGQAEAGRWVAEWLTRWGTRNWGGDYKRVWSAILNGGRRSGKTHLCVVALLMFATMKPRALTWCVSPTIDTGAEIDEALFDLIPAAWKSERVEATNGKSTTYYLPNGSKIVLKSGVNPDRLKAGRVDFALYNEAQLQSHKGYTMLHGAIADRGGLVLMAANPAGQQKGAWVEEHFIRAQRAELDGVAFQVDNLLNPWIEIAALLALQKELSEKDYAREVLGRFEPVGDLVMHAYRKQENNVDPEPALRDVTRQVTERLLGKGKGAEFIVGVDCQVEPYMAATVHKLFADPLDPAGFLNWIVDEFAVEESDEDGLLDAIESTPEWVPADDERDPERCYTATRSAVVMDASAWWQDNAHTPGRKSDKKLRARGWHNLHRPDKTALRNPLVKERVKTGNAALRTADGRRRFFIAKHCTETAQSFGKWEMNKKLCIPDRASPHTHLVDCGTYVEYRLRGNPKPRAKKPPTYDRVPRQSSPAARRRAF